MSESTPTDAVKSGEGTPTDADSGSQGNKPTITEAQLRERLGREAKKLDKAVTEAGSAAVSKFREEHGIDDALLDALRDKRDQEKVVFQRSDVDKLHAEIKRLGSEREKAAAAAEKLTAAWSAEKKSAALVSLAADHEAIKPGQVAALLSSRVKLDSPDGEPYVVGDDGKPTGQTLPEMVKGFLDDNLHMLRPRSRGDGAGSRPGGRRNGDPEEGSLAWQQDKMRKLFGG